STYYTSVWRWCWPVSRRTSATGDVMPLLHPLQWDGVDGGRMAKKAPASKRLTRPKTPEGYLARLRQFEPHPTPFADFQEECPRRDPQEVGPQNTREKRIDDVLSN